MEAINLCVDQGNTRIKFALFDHDRILHSMVVDTIDELNQWLQGQDIHQLNVIYSTSGQDKSAEIQVSSLLFLDHHTPLPIALHYDSPLTLGNDRKANACGAFALFPGKNSLIIDAGTCITYDIVNKEAVFVGGAISPGIQMKARAMSEFTARLPEILPPFENLTSGQSTSQCLHSGALHGSILEAQGRIDELSQQFDDLHVLLTGGDATYFESALKNATFADSNLTLRGLNEILKHQK